MKTLDRREFDSSNRLALYAVGAFVPVFSVGALVLWMVLRVKGIRWNTPLPYVAIAVTLFAALIDYAFVRLVIRHKCYGRCTLKIVNYPEESNGAIRGELSAGRYLALQRTLYLELLLLKMTRARAQDSMMQETLWREEVEIDVRNGTHDGRRYVVPFEIGGVPTEPEEDGKAAIVWRLQARSSGPRPHCQAVFTLSESASPLVEIPGR